MPQNPLNIPEGAMISEEDLNKLGLTEAEKEGILRGDINPSLFKLPEGKDAQETQKKLEEQLRERIKQQSSQRRNIADPTPEEELTTERQEQVLAMADRIRSFSSKQEETQTPVENTETQTENNAFSFDPSQVFGNNTETVTAQEPPEEEQTDTKSTETPTEEEKPDVCPHCLMRTDTEPDMPSEEDKQKFRRSIVNNEPFIKEEELFGGQLKVRFRTRPRRCHDIVRALVDKELQEGHIPSQPPAIALEAYPRRFHELQMVLSLEWMTGMKEPMPPLDDPKWKDIDIAELYDQIFGSRNEATGWAILSEFLRFESIVARMTEMAQSPDFWNGTGGRS